MPLIPQTKTPYHPPSAYVKNVPKKPVPVSNTVKYGATDPTHNTFGGVAAPNLGVTAPPPAPVVPGHWVNTDYASLIPGQWEVTDAQAQGNQLRGQTQASFQEALRRAFIDYGGDASKLGDYSKYLDAPTIEAAQQNKFSQTAQNLAAMTKSLAQQRAALAARGILSSGQATTDTDEALKAREQADYGATRSFLGGAEQGANDLASTEAKIADMINAARLNAGSRLAGEYPSTWDPGTPAAAVTPPPAAAAPKPAAPAFGGVVSTKRLANGSTVTTYANGRQVQQAPGKPAYVINQGR